MALISRRSFVAAGLVATAASCTNTRFRSYNGPEVTSILAFKQERTLQIYHYNELLESYHFELGFNPVGDKVQEGDGRTPEGRYWIDRRNPNSRYHLSVGISYPNDDDRALAAAMGVRPGGDIMIHGTPKAYRGKPDWTVGCLAVSNREIEDIYAMVRVGTPIFLYPSYS